MPQHFSSKYWGTLWCWNRKIRAAQERKKRAESTSIRETRSRKPAQATVPEQDEDDHESRDRTKTPVRTPKASIAQQYDPESPDDEDVIDLKNHDEDEISVNYEPDDNIPSENRDLWHIDSKEDEQIQLKDQPES